MANVLRGTGSHVRLIVARAVESGSGSEQNPELPVLPSSVLNSEKELETHLHIAEVASSKKSSSSSPVRGTVANTATVVGGPSSALANDMVLPSTVSEQVSIVQHKPTRSVDQTTSPMRDDMMAHGAEVSAASAAVSYVHHDMPEMEQLEVELVKDSQGLGITIAGYTCEREELSGIFVKSVNEGSAAHRSGKVAVNDQIIEVDGNSIQGYTNQQAVEMLRSTGKTVRLKLVRYVHGLKFEQLQQAIANSQTNSQATTPASSKPPPQQLPAMIRTDSVEVTALSENLEISSSSDYDGDLDPTKETELVAEWRAKMGPGYLIVIAQMAKFKQNGGLGISLEGTVEKVDGEEQNPHHYIRSVLPNGPVGQNGKLQSGDELLEVNGRKLLGLYHTDVVAILKELPMNVRIVCARSSSHNASVGTSNGNTSRSDGMTGSFISSIASDRMFKAKSDGSISSAGTVTEGANRDVPGEQQEPQSKLKSR